MANIHIPEMVDLGLPSGLKWAKWNIGASKETDFGLYFKYGEAEGHTMSQLGHFNKSYPNTFTDAAAVAYGEGYRMPTCAEFNELIKYTNHSVEIIENVSGVKYINKVDNSKYIFIPFAGKCYNGSFGGVGCNGYLWSRLPGSAGFAGNFECRRNGRVITGVFYRFAGFSIRAVIE